MRAILDFACLPEQTCDFGRVGPRPCPIRNLRTRCSSMADQGHDWLKVVAWLIALVGLAIAISVWLPDRPWYVYLIIEGVILAILVYIARKLFE